MKKREITVNDCDSNIIYNFHNPVHYKMYRHYLLIDMGFKTYKFNFRQQSINARIW